MNAAIIHAFNRDIYDAVRCLVSNSVFWKTYWSITEPVCDAVSNAVCSVDDSAVLKL